MTRNRLARTTRRLTNGTTVQSVKLVPAKPQEWEIQAEACRLVRLIPGYGDEVAPGVTFTFAADFNAGRRGRQESVKAKATGIKSGEEDLRFYKIGGEALLIEMKGPDTPISAEQKKRHALHRHLGFRVEVVRGKTIEQGAADVVALVTEWLAESANDNKPWRAVVRLATVLETIKVGEFVKWDREPGASFLVRAEVETDMVSEQDMVIGDVVEIVRGDNGRQTIRRAVVAGGAR